MSIYQFESAGKYLVNNFVENKVPEAMSTLSEDELRWVENGEGDFPVEIIKRVRDGADDEKQRVLHMIAIAGTWYIAATDSYWAAGQIDGDSYSARVGIVLMTRSPESYYPVHKQMEMIALREADSDQRIGHLASTMTREARMARKPAES
ncbi:hypothetical protein [Corynebacterium ammoniagenes]|uniref:Uncharacterized protein n=1 Tax=Corynebacterium ammoniagenes TaxID=1697 RepID=A0AAV5G6K3_CORAM|nr:hypothetical protein [Corynebacterium ammoniagenes]GJN41745.1 hypothetical protein CAT723_02240 [Corynebacterium ammoniagenes]